MSDYEPTIQTISMIEAQSVLSNIVAQVSRGNSRVLLEESGIPIAAIVSVDDLEQLNQFERRREAFFAKVDRLQEAFKDVPPAEIEQETDRIIARNRAADRSAREETAAAR